MSADEIGVSNATKVIKGRTVLDGVSWTCRGVGSTAFWASTGPQDHALPCHCRPYPSDHGLRRSLFGSSIGRDCDYPPNLGLSLDTTGFWEDRTALSNLTFLASIRGVAGEPEARHALERVGLDPYDKRKVSAFSMGMRQRLSLAQAVMEAPELLILDEPTNALDVDGVDMVARLISKERDRGCTVLVSCHNEPKVEALFDQTFRLYEGRLTEGEKR